MRSIDRTELPHLLHSLKRHPPAPTGTPALLQYLKKNHRIRSNNRGARFGADSQIG